MLDFSRVELKDLIQAVNLLFSILPKFSSAIKTKFGKKKGKEIISRMYQELLKPNPDMAIIADMMSEVEAIKGKPIGVLPRAKLMKDLIEKDQRIKIVGQAKITKLAKKISAGKIGSGKSKALSGILIGKVERVAFNGKRIITPRGKSKVSKKGRKRI